MLRSALERKMSNKKEPMLRQLSLLLVYFDFTPPLALISTLFSASDATFWHLNLPLLKCPFNMLLLLYEALYTKVLEKEQQKKEKERERERESRIRRKKKKQSPLILASSVNIPLP